MSHSTYFGVDAPYRSPGEHTRVTRKSNRHRGEDRGSCGDTLAVGKAFIKISPLRKLPDLATRVKDGLRLGESHVAQ